jgi:hypothetical protein
MSSRTRRSFERRAPYFWMLRLAERLARRERLVRMRAPRSILEAEERLVDDGIDRLTAGETLFVMFHGDELRRDFDPLEKSRTGIRFRRGRDPAEAS